MRPLADQSTLFISDVADVFSAGEGYCDNRSNTVQGEQQWALLQRTPHAWRTKKVSPLAWQEMICEKHMLRRNLFLLGALSITHMTTSAYTCTSAFRQNARPNKNPANSQTKSLFSSSSSYSFLFRRTCHAKCFELQPQNVLFPLQRVLWSDPALSICSNYSEQRKKSRESAAQRKAPRTKKPHCVNISTWVWNGHVKTYIQASIYFTDYHVIAGTDLKNKVWFKTFHRTSFLISRGTSPVDHRVKMTCSRVRHSARTAINSQLKTRGQHQSAV